MVIAVALLKPAVGQSGSLSSRSSVRGEGVAVEVEGSGDQYES